MIVFVSKQEKELVERLRSLGPSTDFNGPVLSAEVLSLKRQIADLEISKGKLLEDFEKRERELRHMVGLEKQRQEAERAQAKIATEQVAKEAVISVREENLAADKKRFEEQLAFNTERFATMETYLKEMMSDILERLPNVNFAITKKTR